MAYLAGVVRHFNRFELKYVLTLQQAERFKSALLPYVGRDEHCGDGAPYALGSLYYDSPDLRCYWEKEYGLRHRRKLRIRRYETGEPLTEATPVFVEIKQRVDRVTQKRRVILPYGEALRLCNDRQLPECAADDRKTVEEVYVFLWQYNLRPASIVRYRRQAFEGTKYDPGLRVTFDTELSFQAHPLHLHEEPLHVPDFAPNQVVMEIKVNERVPIWLSELIAAHGLQMVRISKYCRSIDAAQQTRSLFWRNLPAEGSEGALASALSTFDRLQQKMGIGRT